MLRRSGSFEGRGCKSKVDDDCGIRGRNEKEAVDGLWRAKEVREELEEVREDWDWTAEG